MAPPNSLRALGLLLPALLVAFLAWLVGCSPYPTPGEFRAEWGRRGFDGEALSPRSRGAWRRLKQASAFGATTSGWTFAELPVATDTLTLWQRGEREALCDIALNGTWEGRLWALCALRQLDWDVFQTLAPEFRHNSSEVYFGGGCVAWHGTVSEAFLDYVANEKQLYNLERSHRERGLDFDAWLERERRDPDLAGEVGAQAFAALEASRRIDLDGPLSAELDRLLESESWVVSAGLLLSGSEHAAPRYWGARVLREARPAYYASLRPRLARDPALVTCLEPGGAVEHGLDEALTLHVDAR